MLNAHPWLYVPRETHWILTTHTAFSLTLQTLDAFIDVIDRTHHASGLRTIDDILVEFDSLATTSTDIPGSRLVSGATRWMRCRSTLERFGQGAMSLVTVDAERAGESSPLRQRSPFALTIQ